jgi:hypothetical protein
VGQARLTIVFVLCDPASCNTLEVAILLLLCELASCNTLGLTILLSGLGEPLPQRPSAPLFTRPVATLRGTLRIAHDAGHHAAPLVATAPSNALPWTDADRRAHALTRAYADNRAHRHRSGWRQGYVSLPAHRSCVSLSCLPCHPP